MSSRKSSDDPIQLRATSPYSIGPAETESRAAWSPQESLTGGESSPRDHLLALPSVRPSTFLRARNGYPALGPGVAGLARLSIADVCAWWDSSRSSLQTHNLCHGVTLVTPWRSAVTATRVAPAARDRPQIQACTTSYYLVATGQVPMSLCRNGHLYRHRSQISLPG